VGFDSSSPWLVIPAWTATIGKFALLAWVPVVLLGAWGLFLIFDPTGLAPDTFRRWLDGWRRFSVSAASTVLAAALLAGVLGKEVRADACDGSRAAWAYGRSSR
jgi:hypothetical protein